MTWHYVYRLTCTHPAVTSRLTARYYYGCRSSRRTPQDGPYWSSSKPVQKAIQRYGLASFTKKIVAIYATRAEAMAKEIALHARFDVKTHLLFFNRANQTTLKFSRAGVRCSPETVEKIRLHVRGRVYAPEVGAKRGAERRGKTLSPEVRRNMSLAQLGKVLSEETKAKMAASHIGKVHSPETKAKIAAGTRGKGRSKVVTPETRQKLSAAGLGRLHTPETRAKMAASQRGKTHTPETRAKIAEAQRKRWAAKQATQGAVTSSVTMGIAYAMSSKKFLGLWINHSPAAEPSKAQRASCATLTYPLSYKYIL